MYLPTKSLISWAFLYLDGICDICCVKVLVLVRAEEFESPTFSTSMRRSNQLS